MDDLWDIDKPVIDYCGRETDPHSTLDVPRWIYPETTCSDVAAIVKGGCASGAYMPAVTYHQALKTMNAYGDEVLDYLEDWSDLYVAIPLTQPSWAGIAVHYLSRAVEMWAHNIEAPLISIIKKKESDGQD